MPAARYLGLQSTTAELDPQYSLFLCERYQRQFGLDGRSRWLEPSHDLLHYKTFGSHDTFCCC